MAHYRLNQRSDTGYWRENTANQALSENLKAMMTAWFTHQPIAETNTKLYGREAAYAPMSWHALFAGYGTFPPPEKMQPAPEGLEAADVTSVRAMLGACARNFADYTPA